MELYSNHHFLIWIKIFAFNSAKNYYTTNKFLIFYNCILVAIYMTVLYFRFVEKPLKNQIKVNSAVLNIQFATYMFAIFSNIISNWWNSKSFLNCFKMLAGFDGNLIKMGMVLDHKKIRNVLYVSFFLSLLLFLYVAVFEYVFTVALKPIVSIANWFAFFIPVGMVFFATCFITASLYLLCRRFSILVEYLRKQFKQEFYSAENLKSIKNFVKMFIEIMNITNSMIPLFSLQICALFVLTAVTVTNNLFLVLRGKYNISFTLTLVNMMCLQILEMLAVVVAHYQINSQVSSINSLLSMIIANRSGSSQSSNEWIECHLLVDKTKLEVQVFGMFTVSPATLLGVTAWIGSYLLIMIQFTPENVTIGTHNIHSHSPTLQ